MSQHPDLILRDGSGNPVIDADWNEMLIDVSTPAKRTAVAAIVGGWIDGCAAAGFDAIEIDNLDSYSRSGGRLTEANAVATMALLRRRGARARPRDRAEELGGARRSQSRAMGTDFVVAEECNRYSECDVYTARTAITCS